MRQVWRALEERVLMNYQEWEKKMPDIFTGDALWKMKVYRLALFAGEIGWEDVTKLSKDIRTHKLSDQLYRALGSVGANIAEGYSRSTGPDRVRFYAYSGSSPISVLYSANAARSSTTGLSNNAR
jgi:four helix bundle protein